MLDIRSFVRVVGGSHQDPATTSIRRQKINLLKVIPKLRYSNSGQGFENAPRHIKDEVYVEIWPVVRETKLDTEMK